ncbi:MAG: ABC transporter permease subunit, partial [Acidimicrobiales bacterium]
MKGPAIAEGVAGLWWRAGPWGRRAVMLGALAVAVVVPLGLSPTWQAVLFAPVAIYVLLALGLNVVVGEAGLLDLGYVAFYAVGAYTTAKLTTTADWTSWETVIPAILIAALA